MTVNFTKAEGSQNDFVIIDDRNGSVAAAVRPSLSIAMCHRRKGIGADGVIFIDPSETADFKMSFFNPDGSVGSMCGNGGRCAALFAHRNNIAPAECAFEVLNRVYRAVVKGDVVRLYFPEPEDVRLDTMTTVSGSQLPCQYADTGAPHAVVFTEDLNIDSVDALNALSVEKLGHEIRHLGVFKEDGTNANFVYAGDDGILYIRTFEKGVEAETESCGTGTIASAIVAYLKKGIEPPLTFKTRSGDTLRVGFNVSDENQSAIPNNAVALTSLFADGLYFEGLTHLVFQGIYDVQTAR